MCSIYRNRPVTVLFIENFWELACNEFCWEKYRGYPKKIVLYQFLEIGTSDITFMGRDQELKRLAFSLYPHSFFLYSPFKTLFLVLWFFSCITFSSCSGVGGIEKQTAEFAKLNILVKQINILFSKLWIMIKIKYQHALWTRNLKLLRNYIFA